MRAVRSIALLVLALWLPGTAHCSLAALPAFDFLACAQNEAASDPHPAGDDDACSTVETIGLRAERLEILSAPIGVVSLAIWLENSPITAHLSAPVVRTSPCDGPDLVWSWRFSQRAVAPPRAPSL